MRYSWDQLPAPVRDRITDQCGTVAAAISPGAGEIADFAATLQTEAGRVFCKAARLDSPTLWMARKEIQAAPAVRGIGAGLLWHIEADGWLATGWEHIPGRHADLTPGSADLPLVADSLAEIADRLTPAPPLRTFSLAQRWAASAMWVELATSPSDLTGWQAAHLKQLTELEHRVSEAVAGNTLAHTDMTAPNILVDDARVRIIDWAWPAPAAAWVDTASMIPRLIAAGHHPHAAHEWALKVPHYAAADPAAVTSLAATITARWQQRAVRDAGPWPALARAAQAWTAEFVPALAA